MTAFALSLLAAGIVLWSTSAKSVLAACGIGLAVWLIFGSLTDLVLKAGIGKVSASKAFARFKGLPRSVFGTALAHIGLGVTLLGIVSVTTFGTENVLIMRPGDTAKVQDYTLRFEGLRPLTGSNFTENRGTFTLLDSSARTLGQIEPSKRFFPARQMPTTESGIRTLWFSQVYVALGDEPGDGSVVVRIWWKPDVTLIWYGALVMMVGALFSWQIVVCGSARRHAVANPRRKKRRPQHEKAVGIRRTPAWRCAGDTRNGGPRGQSR